MNSKKVLISGAGIGGLTLAYFLQKNGFTPVVIEKAPSLRHNGYMIDFFSSGIFVSEKMGIMEELKSRDHDILTLRQHDKNSNKELSLNLSTFKEAMNGHLQAAAAWSRRARLPRQTFRLILKSSTRSVISFRSS